MHAINLQTWASRRDQWPPSSNLVLCVKRVEHQRNLYLKKKQISLIPTERFLTGWRSPKLNVATQFMRFEGVNAASCTLFALQIWLDNLADKRSRETLVKILKKNRVRSGLVFFANLSPLRGSALEPAARRVDVVRIRTQHSVGFFFTTLSLLSHGEPHATETTRS